MSFRNALGRGFLPACLVVVVLLATPAFAQMPDLTLDVGDTSAYPGDTQVAIEVYLSNYYDSVAGYNFWVMLDRPDIAVFTTEFISYIDTTHWVCNQWSGEVCLDSTLVGPGNEWDFYHVDTTEIYSGGIDSSGTLTAGWETMDSRSLGGQATDLNIVAIADQPGPPTTPGIGPQQDGGLIKLLMDVYDIPDTMTDRTVNIMVQTAMADHFCFSTPEGQCIGLVQDSIVDSTFFRCLQWVEDVCLYWDVVSSPPYDSVFVETVTVPAWNVEVYNGSLTIFEPFLRGDFNDDGSVDIADLVFIVDWMFGGGPGAIPLARFDCDGDGEIDISDLVCWVGYFFPPVD